MKRLIYSIMLFAILVGTAKGQVAYHDLRGGSSTLGLNDPLLSPGSLSEFDGYGGAVPNSPNGSWYEAVLTIGNGSRGLQVAHEYPFYNELYFRGGTDGWHSWRRVLNDANYASFALPLSGGTLSGALTGTSAGFSGNVGIGTTSPVSRLDVQGLLNVGSPMNIGAFGAATIHAGGSGASTAAPYMVMESTTAYSGVTPLSEMHVLSNGADVPEIGWTTGIRPGNMLIRSHGTGGGGNISLQALESISFLAGNTQTMVVNSAGNVGIGTTTPGSFKLAVEGKIGGRKVVVTQTTPWPDYVFHRNYPLPSLQDVEAYIKKHHHLPDVISAKEVKEKGLDLGENQAMLLKKIEELTLYAIEQNRKLAAHEKKIYQLLQRMEKLAPQPKQKNNR